MRLGSHPADLVKGSLAHSLYNRVLVDERHRHRYEVNNAYRAQREAAGPVISGTSPHGALVEFIELPRDMHPYYIAAQAHPELRSRPTRAHPLSVGLIGARVGAPGRHIHMTISDEPRHWEVLRREVLGAGAISSFINDEVVTPSGETLMRQFINHPGAVCVVAWDEGTDTIACLHQYRHPVGMELVEIPAGLLDEDGEDWLHAAQRELAEEVELAAERWQVLVDVCPTAGASEESQRIYLARGLTHADRPDGFELEGEEAEMSWEWLDRASLLDAVLEGQCQSQSLVTGVLALETARLSGRLESLRGVDAPWPIRSRPKP